MCLITIKFSQISLLKAVLQQTFYIPIYSKFLSVGMLSQTEHVFFTFLHTDHELTLGKLYQFICLPAYFQTFDFVKNILKIICFYF